MRGGEQNNLDEIREEHLKQVFQRYQDRAKAFRSSFSILCIFALAFLFIILIPYVSIKARRHEIDGRLEELSADVVQRETRIEAYQRAIEGYKTVRLALENGPDHLRDFILALGQESELQGFPSAEATAEQFIDQEQPGACQLLSGAERLDCQVHQEIQRLFAGYQASLRRDLVQPLQGLDEEVAPSIDVAALDEGLDVLQGAFEAKLEETPDFWGTYGGKEDFFGELRGGVDRFWRESGAGIEEQYRALGDDLAELREARADLEERQIRLQAEEEQVAERLSQIESPLGRLPIGLNESVAVFPVLLAIGFGISASRLLEAMRLRRTFRTLYQQKDPGRAILTDEQVALIAPLWIDPADSGQNRIVQFGILFVPLAVFAAACGLIFYSWTIADPVASFDVLNRWIYSGPYALSLAVFVYSYWQLIRMTMAMSHLEPDG